MGVRQHGNPPIYITRAQTNSEDRGREKKRRKNRVGGYLRRRPAVRQGSQLWKVRRKYSSYYTLQEIHKMNNPFHALTRKGQEKPRKGEKQEKDKKDNKKRTRKGTRKECHTLKG
jgi:hypothetical protein